MSSYEYNQLLKFLYFEGYADSYEEAEYILEDMSDDEFEELIEIRTQKPWSASKTARFNREIERQKKQLEKTPNSSLRPGDQKALKRMIARGQSPTRSASKPDPTPTEKPKGTRTIKKTELASIVKEDFDIISEFLFVEGYADTIESAELMAESISEEWVEEILDEKHVKAMDTTKRGADHRTRFPKFKGKDHEFDPKFTQQRVGNNNKKIDPYYSGRRERKDEKRQGTGGFSS
jgi:Glu-tRNA(Gln) amidotransferase subunit E-like FAD-binding protein